MTPTDRILAALRGHGHEPRKAGAGWYCRCPAHDDRNPSLSIDVGDDGRALVCCHASCTVDAVCGAIGLRPADLFTDDPTGRNGHAPKTRRRGDGDETTRKPARGGDSVTVASDPAGGRTFPTARDAVAELERRHGARSTTWTYHSADGEPVGLVVRWDHPPVKPGGKPTKTYRPVWRADGGAGWFIGSKPNHRPLYALPDLLATTPGASGGRVYVTEGEKATDAARAIGLTATTSPHGSKSASKADWSPLAGRDVVILPDHDDAGELYAADVARLTTAAGAKSVRIVRLVELWAEMAKGGDMVDLVERSGGDADALERLRVEVEALADKTEADTVTPEAPDGGTVPAFTPFPADMLPEPIRSFVTEAAKAIGCDASYIALPLLSGLASAIGNTHRIALKRGWTEPAIVWTAIVGESGTAKSPAIEVAMRPIRKRQHEAMKRHTAAMEEYRDALAVYERDLGHWRRSKSDAPPPAKPELPIGDRCWTDDVTTEALAVLLQQNPRGLLLVKDELAAWFNFDRYAGGKGGGDAAKWLEMFGGRPMVVDRKTGGTLYVPRAAVSIAGGIQPETLRRALGQEHRDNGLAARLLLACPPRKPKRWTEADVDSDTEAAVARVFDRLFALTPETDDGGDERPRLVTLADDGKRAWVMFYNEHAGEQVNLSGDEAAAWSKLEGYAARFALVIHLTRWATDDPTLRDPARVDKSSIAAGVVLARWFGDEARRVYAILGESDEGRDSRRLVEWIERKGGTVTVRDLTRGPREYRGDPERATKALGDLVTEGVGRWEVDDHAGGRGRPADRFRLLSRRRDTGDGDVNSGNAWDRGVSVTVATVAEPMAAGDGWGET
ncbi:MAG: DUF3987 domain-containing protein [Phycisphaerales bacterium]|nr:DUF3987 domain-containing protein [Phycisphaerales bacterium]